MELRAKAKYEIGDTLLIFRHLSKEQLDYISTQPFEYSCPQENDGVFPGFGRIRRNLVKAKSIKRVGEDHNAEYHVTVDLDLNCLSTSRRHL